MFQTQAKREDFRYFTIKSGIDRCLQPGHDFHTGCRPVLGRAADENVLGSPRTSRDQDRALAPGAIDVHACHRVRCLEFLPTRRAFESHISQATSLQNTGPLLIIRLLRSWSSSGCEDLRQKVGHMVTFFYNRTRNGLALRVPLPTRDSRSRPT